MDFINSWLQGIIIAVVVATIIEMIMPNGNNKKYIKVVLGVYIVFSIITPIVNQFVNSDFEISSIIDVDKYTKELDKYDAKVISNNIDKSNEENIKQIYVTSLKNDIKAKLEERGYFVDKIEIDASSKEDYKIENLSIYLKEKQEENEEVEKFNFVNEIEKVNIQIGETKQENNVNENRVTLSKTKEKEIKQYLSSTYEIKESQIYIY